MTPTPEQQLQAISDRGQQAEFVLENPVFAEAFEGLIAQTHDRIAACDVHDAAALQYQAQNLAIIKAVRAQFVSFISAGTEAGRALAEQRRRLEAEQAQLEREENSLLARGMRQVQRLRA